MPTLTQQLIKRIACRKLAKPDLPEVDSRHFNISTLEYINLVESEDFIAAMREAWAELVEHVETSLNVEIEGEDLTARFGKAAKLSRDLPTFSRFPDSWGF